MSYRIEHTGKTGIVISGRAPYAELELLLPRAARAISEEIEVEGFRKGKAPYEVIKAKVGEFKILEAAARRYIHDCVEKILEEVAAREYKGKSFEPVGEPKVTVTKLAPGEDLEFKITLPLLPPIELPDYTAIARRVLATREAAKASEQEIAEAIQWLRESRAKLVTVNRAAGAGDRVEVDFSAKLGGVALESGSLKNHPFILGRRRFMPGFEDELAGMKAGEDKSFTLAVPQDWRDKAIAGKAVTFRVRMRLVQEREIPAWDDTFAKSIGNFSSAADVQKNIADGLRMEKEAKERERIRMAIVEAIARETNAEIPHPIVDRELEKMLRELRTSVGGMGLTYTDYLAGIKRSESDLHREWRPDAERRVKIALILREIAKREHIQPTEEEVKAAVNRTAAERGMTDADVQSLDRDAFVGYHAGIARNEKVFQWLETLGP